MHGTVQWRHVKTFGEIWKNIPNFVSNILYSSYNKGVVNNLSIGFSEFVLYSYNKTDFQAVGLRHGATFMVDIGTFIFVSSSDKNKHYESEFMS